MRLVSGDTYEVTIGPYGNTTDILFYISAKDTSYYGNIGVNDNNNNFYITQILVFEPEPTPTPTPIPTPSPEPSPSPEPTHEPKPSGICGFPMESLFVGFIVTILVLWCARAARVDSWVLKKE